jgi:hypothetical protein
MAEDKGKGTQAMGSALLLLRRRPRGDGVASRAGVAVREGAADDPRAVQEDFGDWGDGWWRARRASSAA